MEAVAAHAVLFIELVRQGIHVRLGRHGRVESGVENDNVGHILAKHLLRGTQTQHAGGVVQRSQGAQLFISLDQFFGDQCALAELLAAVDAAVADGADLADIVDDLAFAGSHHLNDLFKSLGVGGEGSGDFPLAAANLVGDAAAFHADTLAQALAQHLLAIHIDELILQGRGAAVDNQNFHDVCPPVSSFYVILFLNSQEIKGITLTFSILCRRPKSNPRKGESAEKSAKKRTRRKQQ